VKAKRKQAVTVLPCPAALSSYARSGEALREERGSPGEVERALRVQDVVVLDRKTRLAVHTRSLRLLAGALLGARAVRAPGYACFLADAYVVEGD
jgi:hypothetical protein